MPARSVKQRRLFAIAEHHPEMLYKKNMGVMGMKKDEMHKMAATKEKGLVSKLSKRKIK